MFLINSPSNFFLRSSRNRVDLISYKSKPTDKWEQYDWIAKNIRTVGNARSIFFPASSHIKVNLILYNSKPAEIQVHYPSKFFTPLQLCWSHLSVGLLSYDSRWTLIRVDRRKKFGRVQMDGWKNMDGWKKKLFVDIWEKMKKRVKSLKHLYLGRFKTASIGKAVLAGKNAWHV